MRSPSTSWPFQPASEKVQLMPAAHRDHSPGCAARALQSAYNQRYGHSNDDSCASIGEPHSPASYLQPGTAEEVRECKSAGVGTCVHASCSILSETCRIFCKLQMHMQQTYLPAATEEHQVRYRRCTVCWLSEL